MRPGTYQVAFSAFHGDSIDESRLGMGDDAELLQRVEKGVYEPRRCFGEYDRVRAVRIAHGAITRERAYPTCRHRTRRGKTLILPGYRGRPAANKNVSACCSRASVY